MSSSNPPLAVRQCGDRGRGLFTTRNIKPGETLICEPPLLLIVTDECKLNTCCNCLKISESDTIRICTSCKRACFCSDHCEAEARRPFGHHEEFICMLFANIKWSGLNDEAQDTLRYLIHALALRHGANHNPVQQEKFTSLVSLAGEGLEGSSLVMELHERLCQSVENLLRSKTSVAEVSALMHKELVNAYGIMAPSSVRGETETDMAAGETRGIGMYAMSSLINHECIPNVARCEDFDKPGEINTSMIFKTLHDLPEGTEILQSYFPMTWGLEERQKQLRTVYGFECCCQRCKIEGEEKDAVEIDGGDDAGEEEMEENDEMDSTYLNLFFLKYICPQGGCEGTLVPQLGTSISCCNKCDFSRTEEDFLLSLEEDASDMDGEEDEEMEADD
ncbi:hypothetical protein BSKO_11943 [Bryopsis sp. KO-2023]|nr:hypothetical protein BSKO_11943 [Bryopsis sp. KO-2023]